MCTTDIGADITAVAAAAAGNDSVAAAADGSLYKKTTPDITSLMNSPNLLYKLCKLQLIPAIKLARIPSPHHDDA